MTPKTLWLAAAYAATIIGSVACSTSGNSQGAAPDASTDAEAGRDSGTNVTDPTSGDPYLKCSIGGGTFAGGPPGSCSLCTDDAGTFASAPAGSCNGAPCGGGCWCSVSGLQCSCPDLPGQTNNGTRQYCIALSCGSIICPSPCVCTNPAQGACRCPVDGGVN